MSGPLSGIRVLEFAGLGPTPFAGMMLADLGADVLRVDRFDARSQVPGDPSLHSLNRGRGSIQLNLKADGGRDFAAALAAKCDVLLEGFRPGVMERLGLGPDVLCAQLPALVYARMTGWGQTGSLASKAGHDINYMALTGALHAMGPAGAPPLPPLNLVGDFGGGGMLVVTGILAALVERQRSGRGQVIDAAMVDGVALLMTQIASWRAMQFWSAERGRNLLDGGAYFYRCYDTADDGYIAVGALEPEFHDELLRGLGLDPAEFPDYLDRQHWPDRSRLLEQIFRGKGRDEWVEAFAGLDACVSPVLSLDEAPTYPANAERSLFSEPRQGATPSPAPRLSRTPVAAGSAPAASKQGGCDALRSWGVSDDEQRKFEELGLLRAE